MSKFYGQTYMYPTANDGLREIGVTQGLGGGIWIVAWIKNNGSKKRVKTDNLKPTQNPQELQENLDSWVKKRPSITLFSGEGTKVTQGT
jgi:hypothetical protein